MRRTSRITVAQMVADARRRIEEIDADDTIALPGDPDVVIVDLRDVRERQRRRLYQQLSALAAWLSSGWTRSPYYKDIFGSEAKFVFHCASGWRSAITVDTLQRMGFDNIAHIRDSFNAWLQCRGPGRDA